MHTIPLFDNVHISLLEDTSCASCADYEITITCTNPDVPTDSSNLAHKAAVIFFEKLGIKKNTKIHIEKNIPMAAGMAGGSSNAAAVLRGLNKLCDLPFTMAQLEEMGSHLGADVPYCVRGGTEGVLGIGYDFTKVKTPPDFIYVVACGGEGISTPYMYKKYDTLHPTPINAGKCTQFTGKTENLRIALENGNKNEIISHMFNCFEEIAESERPKIKEIKAKMSEHGCVFSMMSGSGPSVFGIFENLESAQKAKACIEASGDNAFVVFGEITD
jgi:4-diphosphocytidyl-2-C-methyl-D-erythritol kinase